MTSLFVISLVAVLFAALLFLMLVPTWKIFEKAGQSGWKCLIPIYSAYVLVEIAALPWWVFLGFFVPVLNFIVAIIVMYHLSQRFGHGMGYALGMIFLPFIFLPIVGYGKSVYAAPLPEAPIAA